MLVRPPGTPPNAIAKFERIGSTLRLRAAQA
jgi:hypothetical protein